MVGKACELTGAEGDEGGGWRVGCGERRRRGIDGKSHLVGKTRVETETDVDNGRQLAHR